MEQDVPELDVYIELANLVSGGRTGGSNHTQPHGETHGESQNPNSPVGTDEKQDICVQIRNTPVFPNIKPTNRKEVFSENPHCAVAVKS